MFGCWAFKGNSLLLNALTFQEREESTGRQNTTWRKSFKNVFATLSGFTDLAMGGFKNCSIGISNNAYEIYFEFNLILQKYSCAYIEIQNCISLQKKIIQWSFTSQCLLVLPSFKHIEFSFYHRKLHWIS